MAKILNKDTVRYEQEKREFIDGLRNFHYNRGTPFHLTPRCGNKEVDLYLLYQKVTAFGGWKRVTDNLLWEEIAYEMNLPRACLNADQALKNVYIRYLHTYEQIHFLGEDPKTVDTRRDEDGPIRKKHCGPQYTVPLSYNQAQHDIAENLRAGYGLATKYARLSDYEKLEKALMSGLPNEVDFVINVCTLLSNESKHTLRLDRCAILTDLLLAHCGIFDDGDGSLEQLYENCWKKNSDRDFIRFWFDTVHDDEARELISFTRLGTREMCGKEVLHLGRNLGVEDKEGIRITQVAIIIRNLSFDMGNMKFLANNDLVFRFLLLCIYCDYGTLRQLALDTLSNLSAQFSLDSDNNFKSQTILDILVKCIMSSDKFAVVTGLEMVSKLSRREVNEFVISEKLDLSVYEEISKYLTIPDIQLIVYSLEALYQLSEIGEETNTKIAQSGNTVETLVSLITVEAQSYGPNSLIGIKVVEYCPPPHLTGGVAEGMPGAVGPPGAAGQQAAQKKATTEKVAAPDPPVPPSPMDTTTCNWLQATFESYSGGVVSVIAMYSEYLSFCKRSMLTKPLTSQDFLKTIELVFPHSSSVMGQKVGGAKEMCVQGVKKRPAQLPFAIAAPVCKPAVVPASCSVRPSAPVGAVHTPNLAQRLASPPPRTVASIPGSIPAPTHTSVFTTGMVTPRVVSTAPTHSTAGGQKVCAPVVSIPVQTTIPSTGAVNTVQQTTSASTSAGTVGTGTIPTYALTGCVSAQGYVTDPCPPPPASSQKPAAIKSKSSSSKKKVAKKNQPVLPKAEQPPGNLPAIMPKVLPSQTGQITVSQPQMLQNQQLIQNVYSTQEVVYQAVDQQNPESKVLVKTLLAQKIRTGNVIIQQPVQGVMNVQNVELGASGDSQTQTIQYQTSFPQNVQQAFIQYPVPASSTQTIIQQSQPTFVMQSGAEMYVQGQLPTSSLPTQQQLISQPLMVSQQPVVVSQQPMLMSQQPMMVPQQQVMVSQPVVVSQQPISVAPQAVVVSQQQFISQPQMIAQSHMVQNSQFIGQQQTVIPTSQVVITPQSTQMAFSLSSSTTCSTESLPSSVSSVVLQTNSALSQSSVTSSTVTTTTNSSITDSVESASQLIQHSKEPETNVDNPSLATCVSDNVQMGQTGQNDISETTSETVCDSEDATKPSNYEKENENNSAFTMADSVTDTVGEDSGKVELESTETSAELESAVGSIMEESNDNVDSQDDEPVMIENDGNELMFEQQKYQVTDESVNPTTELYVGDEAAMAAEQLEQMEQDDDMESNGVLIISGDTVQGETEECDNETMEVSEELENPNDQIMTDQSVEMCADDVEYKEGSVEKESVMSDEELIAKFRAETPINVPLVSENGLLEQDYEARMAVENLLKDVEFKVNDDDSGEMNVIFACQQERNAGNSRKVRETSVENSDSVVEEPDTKDNGQSESQTSKAASVNHTDASITSKPSSTSNHPLLNGLDSEHKPLMNGDLSSPECPSVPSPSLMNGGDKLVNGIEDGKNGDLDKTIVDKVLKMNGVVNHKISSGVQESKMIEISAENEVDSSEITEKLRTDDILAQSMIDSNIDKSEDSLDQTDKAGEVKGDDTKADPDGDILARSILENGIQPSDCEIPDPEPSSVTAVVKQIIPNTVYGNIMTVQINNNTIPITFTSNAVIPSKNSVGGQINVCNSRHIPTPENARDGELSCDSSSSSITTSEQLLVSDVHSMKSAQSKSSHKDSKKSVASPKSGESKKQKSSSKKRSRSKSGGSSGGDSRPSSVTSPATAAAPQPEFMCEWTHCRQCFDNARKVFNHVCNVHLKTEYDGLCKWEGCESLVRKRWSLFTHVQDHHCSENSLRVAAQRRLQSFQTGQKITAPTIPAMVYPKDAANQAIKRFLPKPPYPEFTEGREGPVTKHIRLTSALILRNLARYSREGRSLLKKHERTISYTCMSAVESSTALASCLQEIVKHKS